MQIHAQQILRILPDVNKNLLVYPAEVNFWRPYQFLVQTLITLPYCSWRDLLQPKCRLENVRTARNTIRFWNETHSAPPRQLVDVGAGNSEWAYWIRKKWMDAKIDSFEPNNKFKPIGQIHRIALDEFIGYGVDKACYITTKVMPFASLEVEILKPALLKVDCEEYTIRALRGFGKRLQEFDMAVVEIWNHKDDLNAGMEVAKIMLDAGFTRSRLVDVITFPGKWPLYEVAFARK